MKECDIKSPAGWSNSIPHVGDTLKLIASPTWDGEAVPDLAPAAMTG
jgi:hypothetical protein